MNYLGYIIASILAIVLGQITKHLCFKMPPWVSEEIDFKTYLKSLKNDFKIDLKYSLIYLILFNLLIYNLGNIYLSYIFMICIFSLMMVFAIDYKYQLIPDETHIIIIICAIINLLFNLSNWTSYLFGALAGGGSFYLLGLLAVLIYKKEGMGFGDVKLMASLGLLFGLKTILVITVLSFALAAIISIILILFKKKKIDSYIPFGPFIVISTISAMYVPVDIFIDFYYSFCLGLGTMITDFIFKFIG